MQIYLHKILPIFILPVGITLLLVLAGLLLHRRWIVWIGISVLWLCSTSLVSDFTVRSVEGWTDRSQAIDAVRADAIVVLSGGRIVAPGPAAVSEWADADRFYAGVELFHAGKGPVLIFTGGWAPWEPNAKPEGEILIDYAKALGVPATRLFTTGPVVNTAQEASAVAVLLDKLKIAREDRDAKFRILLVTSAFHMKRAQLLFERAGLHAIPFPVDFQVSAGRTLSTFDFLPDARALSQTERACREIYGRIFYYLLS